MEERLTGTPDALKGACPVWEEAVRNVPQGNALAAYVRCVTHVYIFLAEE